MAKKPFFSVAIPTYNRASDLKVALNSLLKQKFSDFEIIISDNCSTDDTEKTVKSFKSKKIKYFKNKKNIDVLPNVQASIDKSSGRYIFLHADDDFLIDNLVLQKVKEVIDKKKAGYIRLNYLSLMSDNKTVFDFRASKEFKKDEYLKPLEKSPKIVEFLLNADCSFITGTIFKNDLQKQVKVIKSHLYPWFPIIYYSALRHGAYYVSSPLIIARWSEWRVRKDNFNPLYSLDGGRLTSEKYFEFLKEVLDPKDYHDLLRRHLLGVYISHFPAIKYYVGNNNTVKLSKRIRHFDSVFNTDIYFWVMLIGSLILPRILLKFARFVALNKYKKISANKDYEKVLRKALV